MSPVIVAIAVAGTIFLSFATLIAALWFQERLFFGFLDRALRIFRDVLTFNIAAALIFFLASSLTVIALVISVVEHAPRYGGLAMCLLFFLALVIWITRD